MAPITVDGPAKALAPPSDEEVMRALGKARPLESSLPLIYQKRRNNVRIVKEKIADYVDPPRFLPLIGLAQLHHAQYKCTICSEEITSVGWPIPHQTIDKNASEVIYIEHNHYHMIGSVANGCSPHH